MDTPIITEVLCRFRSTLPDEFQVDQSLEIQLGTKSSNKDLGEIIKQMLEDEGKCDMKEI